MIKYVAHNITSSFKEVSNENSFLHNILPTTSRHQNWNLQKGESLEVAMEILGTSPLGDEEASDPVETVVNRTSQPMCSTWWKDGWEPS